MPPKRFAPERADLRWIVPNRLRATVRTATAMSSVPMLVLASAFGVWAWFATDETGFLRLAVAIGFAALFIAPTLMVTAGTAPRHQAGATGERLALEVLKALPAGYVVLNQIAFGPVIDGRPRGELDYLVVGPTGVFVVEVKHIRGLVCLDPSGAVWIVQRVDRRGRQNTHTMRNAWRQAENHVRLLRRVLTDAGIRPCIGRIVLFTHPDARVLRTALGGGSIAFPGDLLAQLVDRPAALASSEVASIVSAVMAARLSPGVLPRIAALWRDARAAIAT